MYMHWLLKCHRGIIVYFVCVCVCVCDTDRERVKDAMIKACEREREEKGFIL
jgi:hypothetical protein